MRIIHITLIGFLLSILCASVCTMNIGIMQMNNNMQAMHHDMNEQDDASCKHCEDQEIPEIALVSPVTIDDGTIQTIPFALTAKNIFDIYYPSATNQLQYFAINDPPLDTSMINTVVLRT